MSITSDDSANFQNRKLRQVNLETGNIVTRNISQCSKFLDFHGDKFQVLVFWVVTPCSVVGDQRPEDHDLNLPLVLYVHPNCKFSYPSNRKTGQSLVMHTIVSPDLILNIT
jgi:hypothetical protein